MRKVEVFAFRVPNDIKGRKPTLTRWKMTIEEAERRWPGAAVPQLSTREIRRQLTTEQERADAYQSLPTSSTRRPPQRKCKSTTGA